MNFPVLIVYIERDLSGNPGNEKGSNVDLVPISGFRDINFQVYEIMCEHLAWVPEQRLHTR